MGLSNMLQGGGGADTGAGGATAAPATGDSGAAASHKSFGDKLGDYFQSRYPIAGGLAGMVFNPNQNQAPAAPATSTGPTDPGVSMPDYSSLIAQNAQPKQGGGGLAAILKLLA